MALYAALKLRDVGCLNVCLCIMDCHWVSYVSIHWVSILMSKVISKKFTTRKFASAVTFKLNCSKPLWSSFLVYLPNVLIYFLR